MPSHVFSNSKVCEMNGTEVLMPASNCHWNFSYCTRNGVYDIFLFFFCMLTF